MTPDKTKKTWSRIGLEKVRARCDTCGGEWKLFRGDAFVCPYCMNQPEDVLLGSVTGYVMLMDSLEGRPPFP